jgi:molybdate/tungstate transport system substrate-binding protein
VTEIGELVDVVATADSSLIPTLMYEPTVPETGRPYADWMIEFAGNRLALAYTTESLYADEITSENWTGIITRQDVRVGLADPRFDPSGYRALMALQLAEDHYGSPTIFEDFTLAQFTMPLSVEQAPDTATIHIPQIVETRDGAHILVRGASIALIALLEAGDLDYAFEYESVIEQHGLGMVRLPPELNLGDDSRQAEYGRVQVALDFRRFLSVTPVFRGETIRYAVTIPTNAPQPEAAAEFVAYLLGPQGRAVMEANHHPVFAPALTDRLESLPAALRPLCVARP